MAFKNMAVIWERVLRRYWDYGECWAQLYLVIYENVDYSDSILSIVKSKVSLHVSVSATTVKCMCNQYLSMGFTTGVNK